MHIQKGSRRAIKGFGTRTAPYSPMYTAVRMCVWLCVHTCVCMNHMPPIQAAGQDPWLPCHSRSRETHPDTHFFHWSQSQNQLVRWVMPGCLPPVAHKEKETHNINHPFLCKRIPAKPFTLMNKLNSLTCKEWGCIHSCELGYRIWGPYPVALWSKLATVSRRHTHPHNNDITVHA